jgi:hypothetical protein
VTYHCCDEAPVKSLDEAPVLIVHEKYRAHKHAQNNCNNRYGNFCTMRFLFGNCKDVVTNVLSPICGHHIVMMHEKGGEYAPYRQWDRRQVSQGLFLRQP